MTKIYLLDLNYTLASKCKMPFDRNGKWTGAYDPSVDQYCPVLVTYLKAREILGEKVILITARPPEYKSATLDNIRDRAKWDIQESYWKAGRQNVSDFKKAMAIEISQKHNIPFSEIVGIESNAETREKYASLGIKSFTRGDFLHKVMFSAPCNPAGCNPSAMDTCLRLIPISAFTINSV